MSPQERSYPVVILRAGASSGVVNYSTLAEDLASHGYVVVGFDAPYRTGFVTFPGGRVMRRSEENNPEVCVTKPQADQDSCMHRLLSGWTADVGFALDRLERLNTADSLGKFTGRLGLTRVGVFGHSFGGATATTIPGQGGHRCERSAVWQCRPGRHPPAVHVPAERPRS